MITSQRAPAEVYQDFLDALNRRDLDAAAAQVDTGRYRENCVGYTRGFVNWHDAVMSLKRVWQGLPDLRVELAALAGDGSHAVAHGTARATNSGRLYGVPATKRSCEASFFDFVRLEDGLIVERVQQVDVLGQMKQIYGRAFGTVGLGFMLWRI